ncbi:ClpP family protease [Thermanaerothrix sp.]|uniref:ClpP family protease n=1 Tax=Thermanaerothrix sp. TaxID=2972675 RepID=UPI002ADE6530|nr:ATP-dependent Clp protease proteolytic subunit [Thermanaerothrix sp.]
MLYISIRNPYNYRKVGIPHLIIKIRRRGREKKSTFGLWHLLFLKRQTNYYNTLVMRFGTNANEYIYYMSSPGGSVFHGLSIYNFLKGIPTEVFTYNFSTVDSIGIVIYCAGSKRFSVHHARFLIHGVRFNISGNASFDDKQIEEHLKSLRIDQENIARVIADTPGKPLHKIEEDMNNHITLNPNQAKDYGLVHEIKSELLPIDVDFFVIREIIQRPPQPMIHVPAPLVQAYMHSIQVDTTTL